MKEACSKSSRLWDSQQVTPVVMVQPVSPGLRGGEGVAVKELTRRFYGAMERGGICIMAVMVVTWT